MTEPDRPRPVSLANTAAEPPAESVAHEAQLLPTPRPTDPRDTGPLVTPTPTE